MPTGTRVVSSPAAYDSRPSQIAGEQTAAGGVR